MKMSTLELKNGGMKTCKRRKEMKNEQWGNSLLKKNEKYKLMHEN